MKGLRIRNPGLYGSRVQYLLTATYYQAAATNNQQPTMHLLSTRRWWPIIFAGTIPAIVHPHGEITRVSAFASTSPLHPDRRSAMADIASSSAATVAAALVLCLAPERPALAAAVAPFAPVDALLPAARVKVAIDRAVDVASRLEAEKNDVQKKRELLRDMAGLLLPPQNFNRGATPVEVPRMPARQYLNAYDEYRRGLSILEKPGAMLVQNGEIDAWRRLKREERAREDADEVRAALNYYTSNLNFDPGSFVLTGTREERSRLIREDRVPDVKTVIASDMGLRYLLRNDLLTACDDARAELRYQMEQSPGEVDGSELLEVLLAAQSACEKWFRLIDEKDVLAALNVVLGEK